MSRTTFSGPLASGTIEAGAPGGPNVGLAVLAQSVIVNRDATLVQTASFNLPANSTILSIAADVLTAYDSATSATLTVGSAAGGSQYAGGINAKTAGRATVAATAAQGTAMGNIGANTAVYATVTSVGQPTVGQVKVTMLYLQADN